MADKPPVPPPAAPLPTVRPGSAPVAPVAKPVAPGADVRPPDSPATAEKLAIAYGGNKGGRPRKDGLVPGSPEALAADKDANAKRMRDARARAAAERIPPPLPAALPASAPESAAPVAPVAGELGIADAGWNAGHFKSLAPSALNLFESLRVSAHLDLAESGGLSGPVVREIEKNARFPVEAKQSLSETSPDALAKLFNILGVPIALAPYVSTAPLIVYLWIRDSQGIANIKKLIADNASRNPPPAAPPAPSKKP